MIVKTVEFGSTGKLLDSASGVASPEHAVEFAKAINHLAHQQTYTVIENPARFAAWYREKYAAEET